MYINQLAFEHVMTINEMLDVKCIFFNSKTFIDTQDTYPVFTDENTQIKKKVFLGIELMNIIREPKIVFNNADL